MAVILFTFLSVILDKILSKPSFFAFLLRRMTSYICTNNMNSGFCFSKYIFRLRTKTLRFIFAKLIRNILKKETLICFDT